MLTLVSTSWRSNRGPKSTGHYPRGFTLFEVLLVLVLLAIVGALAAPNIASSFSTTRLRRAGDQVITALAQARAKAIDGGQTVQFRFVPNEPRYRIDPYPEEDEGEDVGAPSDSSDDQEAEAERSIIQTSGELAESVLFKGGQVETNSLSAAESANKALKANSRGEWSTPILFYPDGTAQDASLELESDRGMSLRIAVRGVTGIARASAPMTRDQLQRGSP